MDPTVDRRLAAILSADVVGYSRLMAEDEAATVRTLTDYREVVATLIRQHRGRVVDAPGDNLLAEFPTALDAARAALEIQRVMRARNEDLSPERRMEFRIGIHLGDVRAEGDAIYGDGVNIAARLEGLAEPGTICVSGSVYDQVERKIELQSEDLGEQSLKNIARPVRVYRLRTEPREVAAVAPASARRRLVRTAAVVTLGIALGALLVWGELLPRPRLGAPGSGRIGSIAVLPLDNLSGDPEQEYFTDGMTDALIAQLAKIGSLRVISRTSVMHYKGTRKALPEIARELDVDAVLEGSVLRAGNGVRITAQLIDARTDHHLWSESYERDLADVLALQGEVAASIAEQIELTLTPEDRARLAPARRVRPEAYEAYVRGRHFILVHGQGSHRKAIEYFSQAIRIDPGYAEAYAGLADAYT